MESLNKLDKVLNGVKLHSIIQLLVSLIWVVGHAKSLYQNNYGGGLFMCFGYVPDWQLILDIFFGLIGCYIAYIVFIKRIKILRGYLYVTLLFLISITISILQQLVFLDITFF